MARGWQGDASALTIDAPPGEPAARPPLLADDVADGDWVSARLLGWEGRTAPGADPYVLPDARAVAGVLTVMFVESLGTWRLSIDGQSVDPRSVRRSFRPSEPDPLEN